MQKKIPQRQCMGCRERKAKKRKSPAGMLFAGLVWLALSTVLLILFEVSA